MLEWQRQRAGTRDPLLHHGVSHPAQGMLVSESLSPPIRGVVFACHLCASDHRPNTIPGLLAPTVQRTCCGRSCDTVSRREQ